MKHIHENAERVELIQQKLDEIPGNTEDIKMHSVMSLLSENLEFKI